MTTYLNVEGQCETITAIVAAHPKVFKGRYPEITSPIPKGWYTLMDYFFSMLERICSDEELTSLTVCELGNLNGVLELDFDFEFPLPDDQAMRIASQIFAARNKSSVACVECGKIVEDFPEKGEEMLCTKHLNRSKSRPAGVRKSAARPPRT
jgi:hypothetical protein